jgi:CRISPR-associated exonuclease Cas4
MKVDLLEAEGEVVVAAEVKLSRGGERSHRLQLAYYLKRLTELGLKVRGELRYPKERRVVRFALTPELEKELNDLLAALGHLLAEPKPPRPRRIRYCSSCAYYPLCWVEEP